MRENFPFRMSLLLWILAAAVVSTACAGPQIRATAPRPNLVIQDGTAPAALRFGDEVADEFDVPNSDALSNVHVSGWRTTLTFGFRNGF